MHQQRQSQFAMWKFRNKCWRNWHRYFFISQSLSAAPMSQKITWLQRQFTFMLQENIISTCKAWNFQNWDRFQTKKQSQFHKDKICWSRTVFGQFKSETSRFPKLKMWLFHLFRSVRQVKDHSYITSTYFCPFSDPLTHSTNTVLYVSKTRQFLDPPIGPLILQPLY